MKVAVEGCAHGELDKIYETLAALEEQNNLKVDLLLICGDFQSVRNKSDLFCIAVPPCYRKLNTFYKYYSGEAKAPVLTIFIGGNHEASNYLAELTYGGWVAPNIFYLGNAGVIRVGGLRIAGLSGIYKGHDYLRGHFEIPPYNENTKRSVYHVRNLEVFRLKQLSEPTDMVMSHDWPRGVYNFGNRDALLRRKRFFRKEVEENTLGSRPAEELLNTLKPSYWFAAHLHCKFAALVPHENDANETRSYTKFLALDKCLPRRQFLQVLDIGKEITERPLRIEYDLEWLCILRSTDHLLSLGTSNCYMPGPGCTERWNFVPDEEEKNNVKNLFDGNFTVPENFARTSPVHDPSQKKAPLPVPTVNPQTTSFCKKLGVTDPMAALLSETPSERLTINDFTFADEDESDVTACSQVSLNPDEINLDDEDENDEKSIGSDSEVVSDLFFIDRRKTGDLTSTPKQHGTTPGRTSLVMPEPKMSSEVVPFTEERSDELHLSVDELEKKRENEEIDSGGNDAVPPAMTAVKKMKRRNLAIYQAGDDSDS